jgi:hypothetical protein
MAQSLNDSIDSVRQLPVPPPVAEIAVRRGICPAHRPVAERAADGADLPPAIVEQHAIHLTARDLPLDLGVVEER